VSRRDPQGLGYDPPTLRTLVECYSRYIQVINDWRKEDGETMTVGELLGLATILDECHQKRASLQRRLDHVETHRRLEEKRALFHATPKFTELMAACEGRP
jgi:hypothetical protein